MNIVSSATPQDIVALTPDEMQLVRAYRKFVDDTQGFWLEAMEEASKNPECGLRANRPELRVIAGGAA